MQLNKKHQFLMASAVSSLLGSQAHGANEVWEAETSIRYYSEKERVTSVEPVVRLRRSDEEERILDISIGYDTLSGASHNGATVSDQAQTFTSTSGRKSGETESYSRDNDTSDHDDDDEHNTQYTIAPGDVPLDPSFKDNRLAVGLNYSQPLNRTVTASIGGSYSAETDYLSTGINGGFTFNLNQKNTQVGFFLGATNDVSTPQGGTPIGLSSMSSFTAQSNEETKTVFDGLVSLTQVLGTHSIMQLNYSVSQSNGYHTDPYKIISVLDEQNQTQDYLFEKRPEERIKHSLYAAYKLHNFGNTLNLSYRYMWDDWNIKSNTWDVKYRMNFGNVYVQPHVRLYEQTAADFYVDHLTTSSPLPNVASADYRLGNLTTQTFGAKVGWKVAKDHDISIRLESYNQQGDSPAAELEAVVSQITYKTVF